MATVSAPRQSVHPIADPDFKMNDIISDAPLAHFRRVLQQRIDDECAIRPAVTPIAVLAVA